MSKTIVVSAIALRSGGTLSILQDCLQELSKPRYREFQIYALVKDSALAGNIDPAIKLIELDGTGSYFRRLYYEYFYFKKLSRELKPDLWFSLHDITPSIECRRQAVYCHNPSAFFRVSFREFFFDPKFALFTWLYWLLYKINIHRNSWVVVQQGWIRDEFHRMFKVPNEKIVVAHPEIFFPPILPRTVPSKRFTFFYPAFPRVFKNIELIGEAILLLQTRNITDFEVMVTVAGNENGYALSLKRKYGHLPQLKMIGHQSREAVFQLYERSDALVFPSRLETWGLPISEFKQTGRPILAADLPYAHETAGDYSKLLFFDAQSPASLADAMSEIINGKPLFQSPTPPFNPPPKADNWSELFELIVEGL